MAILGIVALAAFAFVVIGGLAVILIMRTTPVEDSMPTMNEIAQRPVLRLVEPTDGEAIDRASYDVAQRLLNGHHPDGRPMGELTTALDLIELQRLAADLEERRN